MRKNEPSLESLIAEFTGKAEPRPRTPTECEAAYLQVVEGLMTARTWPGVSGSLF